MQHQKFTDGNLQTFDSSPGLLASEVKHGFPEVAETARVILDFQSLLGSNNEGFFETGGYADPEFFKIFTFKFLTSVSQEKILSDDKSIVISSRLASKLFGTNNATGKTVLFNRKEEYTVSAVFEDVPENSFFKFDYLLPFNAFLKLQPQAAQWGYNVAKTFVLLHDQNELESLSNKIRLIAKKHDESSHTEFFLYPLSKIYLFGKFKNGKNVGGRIDNLKLVGGIAILILAMACINFINLSTAIANSRAKEVGIRKTIGAGHKQLIVRFLGEALLMASLALVLSIGLLHLIFPVFNTLLRLKLSIEYSNPLVVLTLGATALVTGLLAGLYPAWVLSSYQPIRALKLSQHSTQRIWLRKTLIAVQLVLSISLIVSTVILFKQIHYIKNKELGFTKDNIIRFRAQGGVLEKFESFKVEALRSPTILQMTSTDSAPIGRKSSTTGFSWPGKIEGNDILLEISNVNYDFVETLGMELVVGRSFSKNSPSDSMAVMINEAAVSQMGLVDPIGVKLNSGSYTFEVIGVIKNHNATSVQNDYYPFVFMFSPSNSNIVMTRIAAGKSEEAVEVIKKLYRKFEPAYPFEFTFLDETFMKLYENETRLGNLATCFSALAIFISCLGLLGLSAYSANRRRKEIAVRKVMGASAFRIVIMLNLEYVKLVILSMLLALPVSFYASSAILSGYAFRTEVNEVMILVLSGFFLFAICIVTVSYYSTKAANANPASTLKYE